MENKLKIWILGGILSFLGALSVVLLSWILSGIDAGNIRSREQGEKIEVLVNSTKAIEDFIKKYGEVIIENKTRIEWHLEAHRTP